jgi:hypothetical protein
MPILTDFCGSGCELSAWPGYEHGYALLARMTVEGTAADICVVARKAAFGSNSTVECQPRGGQGNGAERKRTVRSERFGLLLRPVWQARRPGDCARPVRFWLPQDGASRGSAFAASTSARFERRVDVTMRVVERAVRRQATVLDMAACARKAVIS